MRKLFIGALLAVAALAVAAVAWGATQQTYEQSYTSKKPKSSTGTKFHAAATDPDNPEGQQPKPARRVSLGLPAGSVADTRAIPRCRASDEDFAESGAAACPGGQEYLDSTSASARTAGARPRYRRSVVGDGSAVVTTNNGGTINASVVAYNRAGGLILYINPEGANAIVLRPTIRGGSSAAARAAGRSGPVIDTRIAPNCVLGTFNASTNQCEFNGARSPAGEAVLTDFVLNTVPRHVGRGKRRKIFLRTPRRCPRNGRWAFSGTFTYNDGSTETRTSTSPCR